MKKERLLLLLFLAIAIYQGSVYSQGSVGVGLEILDTSGPIISLIGPLNNSGDSDGNITFFYSVSDANNVVNCSLIINSKINASNTSGIIKDTQLSFSVNNTALGIYNWSINCTDSLGYNSSSANWTFTVFSMRSFNGSTTNLSVVNTRNITNFVLEVLPYGKINFTKGVDISRGLDIDSYVNITYNEIGLDSAALPELNKSANLSLYLLTFINPRALMDGAVCPSSICKGSSYSGADFSFNVTHFTAYSAEETPVEVAPPTGGGTGGGGGGGVITKVSDFTIDKETLKVILRQGQTKEESFSIKNTGSAVLEVTTNLQTLKGFIFSPSSDELKITLNPNEEHTLNVVFGAEENLKPDVYTGEIKVRSGTLEKIIGTIIEVDSAKPLFDVDVELLPEYKSIYPGDNILIDVSLFNVRGFGRVDVNLEYSIRDFKGNIIAIEHETVAVETQAKFSRELSIPRELEPGTYVASVKVTFEDSVGISSDIFEVKAKSIRLYPIALRDYMPYLLFGAAFVIIVSVFLAYLFYLPRKKYAPKTKEEKGKSIKTEEKAKKLEKELKALESAYKSKFISEASYKKGKERIEKELKKFRE